MKKPDRFQTPEATEYLRKRHLISTFVHDDLHIPQYGAHNSWVRMNNRMEYDDELQYCGDLILTRALLHALPKDVYPFDYCYEVFSHLSQPDYRTTEWRDNSPDQRAMKAFSLLSDSDRQKLKDILER